MNEKERDNSARTETRYLLNPVTSELRHRGDPSGYSIYTVKHQGTRSRVNATAFSFVAVGSPRKSKNVMRWCKL